MLKIKQNKKGFTIVELLVVIVVIGILAAITIVSYSGISHKAIVASLQSDLDNNSKLLKLYNVEHGYYPNTLDTNKCPLTPDIDTRYCLKASGDTDLTYTGGGQSFTMTATKKFIKYQITESSSPSVPLGLTGPDWITVGAQTWAKANLNVGAMITGTSNQTNNSTLEKYCYDNLESNCTTYGGLYQWNEAMQYVSTEGAQGICPTGSHIPSDNDWTILDSYLGSAAGTKLKSGGSSGLNMLLAGGRYSTGNFSDISSYTLLWSSSESSESGWLRYLNNSSTTLGRDTYTKGLGFSVRCVAN